MTLSLIRRNHHSLILPGMEFGGGGKGGRKTVPELVAAGDASGENGGRGVGWVVVGR